MVTNLSSVSSQLNVILIPDGDYEAHVNNFWINLNLRRMACSGRSALSLQPPT